MPNDWFKYEEKVAETLSEFVSLILDTLKAPYLFRGHADLDWELEPAIDRSDFSGLCFLQVSSDDSDWVDSFFSATKEVLDKSKNRVALVTRRIGNGRRDEALQS